MIKNLKKQKGFTLIELMVVIVIIGILVAIALPNFIGAQDRAKISSVKANMHTVQTMLETYGVDWGGTYPGTAAILATEANTASNPYWKNFVNPFSSGTATAALPGPALIDYAAAAVGNAGKTGYDAASTTKYYLYGYDKVGNFIKDKGSNFTLSNS